VPHRRVAGHSERSDRRVLGLLGPLRTAQRSSKEGTWATTGYGIRTGSSVDWNGITHQQPPSSSLHAPATSTHALALILVLAVV
jgi:hypothetical protein